MIQNQNEIIVRSSNMTVALYDKLTKLLIQCHVSIVIDTMSQCLNAIIVYSTPTGGRHRSMNRGTDPGQPPGALA